MQRLRVLLVEPDVETQHAFRSALEIRGFDVLAANDGVDGLALARAHGVAVIIGDFPMDVPGESPFTSAVRSDPRICDSIIITVTGRHLTAKDSPAWMNSDRVLSKPVSPERLAEEVVWAASRRRNGSAP